MQTVTVTASIYFCQFWLGSSVLSLTLVHSERPKLHAILVFLSAIGLIFSNSEQLKPGPRC